MEKKLDKCLKEIKCLKEDNRYLKRKLIECNEEHSNIHTKLLTETITIKRLITDQTTGIVERKSALLRTPFGQTEDLLIFEETIRNDAEIFKVIENEVYVIGMPDPAKLVRYIWKHLVTDELACEISWIDVKGKISLQNMAITRAFKDYQNFEYMADETQESFHSTEETTKIETLTENTKDGVPSELTPQTPSIPRTPTTKIDTLTENTKDDVPSELTPPTPIPPTPTVSLNEHEILAEQFENYLRIANALMKTLKRPKDIEICTNLLRKVQRLNDSRHLEVKRNNNAFFRYCLKVLKWTSDNQPLELYQFWYCNKDTIEGPTESRTWLEDNKSYMAFKFLKDGTNIIYAAVADDPSAGWQDAGLNILAKRGACSRN